MEGRKREMEGRMNQKPLPSDAGTLCRLSSTPCVSIQLPCSSHTPLIRVLSCGRVGACCNRGATSEVTSASLSLNSPTSAETACFLRPLSPTVPCSPALVLHWPASARPALRLPASHLLSVPPWASPPPRLRHQRPPANGSPTASGACCPGEGSAGGDPMGEVHSGRTVSPQLCHLFPPHLLGSPPCHPASNSDPEGPGDKRRPPTGHCPSCISESPQFLARCSSLLMREGGSGPSFGGHSFRLPVGGSATKTHAPWQVGDPNKRPQTGDLKPREVTLPHPGDQTSQGHAPSRGSRGGSFLPPPAPGGSGRRGLVAASLKCLSPSSHGFTYS